MLLDLLAHRLLRARVAARRDAGKHPLQHDSRQRIAVGEVPVGRKRQLARAVGRPHSRALDPYATTAERHLARLVAVAHGNSLRVVLALRAHDLDHLFLPFAEGIAGGNRPELVINWSPDGRRVVLFDRERLRLVDVATAADIPSQPGLTPAYAPVFLDAQTLVVLANCCIGRQQLVTIDVRSGAISPFVELSTPPEIIRRLKPGLLLTVAASGELALVSRGHTRVIARRITAAAG